jgi:hypothetical protein
LIPKIWNTRKLCITTSFMQLVNYYLAIQQTTVLRIPSRTMPSSETRPSLEAKSSKDHPSSTEKSAPKITSESNENNALVARGRSASKLRSLSWFCIVFSLLAALFLFALDNTIVADVQPRILHTLGGVEKLPWISVAFALGAVSTNLFWYLSPRVQTQSCHKLMTSKGSNVLFL